MTKRRVHRALWASGAPVRLGLIGLIRLYRVILSPLLGGGCRFYPSCSMYAEEAIRNTGAGKGLLLAAWRVLRCSPLSKGGVDYPPKPPKWRREYVDDIPMEVGYPYEAVISGEPQKPSGSAA
jgi:putative membrane protein insertion efficiency factor